MNELLVELLDALDERDKVEQDYALQLLCFTAYQVRKSATQHRVDKARRELRDVLKS